MSGIVGSRFNIRGSGLVGSLGTDGQAFTSSGAGKSAVFEAAGGFDVYSITGATDLAAEPDQTEQIVISDGGTLKRLDIAHITSTPCLAVYEADDQVFGNSTTSKLTWGNLDKQVGGTWASDQTFTPGVAGWYFSNVKLRHTASVDSKAQDVQLWKNGSVYNQAGEPQNYSYKGSTRGSADVWHTGVVFLDADDYVEVYSWQNTGADSTVTGNFNSWQIWRATGTGTS